MHLEIMYSLEKGAQNENRERSENVKDPSVCFATGFDYCHCFGKSEQFRFMKKTSRKTHVDRGEDGDARVTRRLFTLHPSNCPLFC